MDIFQLIGDFLHLIAVLMLLLKIIANKNVIGTPHATQVSPTARRSSSSPSSSPATSTYSWAGRRSTSLSWRSFSSASPPTPSTSWSSSGPIKWYTYHHLELRSLNRFLSTLGPLLRINRHGVFLPQIIHSLRDILVVFNMARSIGHFAAIIHDCKVQGRLKPDGAYSAVFRAVPRVLYNPLVWYVLDRIYKWK